MLTKRKKVAMNISLETIESVKKFVTKIASALHTVATKDVRLLKRQMDKLEKAVDCDIMLHAYMLT